MENNGITEMALKLEKKTDELLDYVLEKESGNTITSLMMFVCSAVQIMDAIYEREKPEIKGLQKAVMMSASLEHLINCIISGTISDKTDRDAFIDFHKLEIEEDDNAEA